MDALMFLTSLMVLLFGGIVSIQLARWLKLPLPLLLFAMGVFVSTFTVSGNPVIQLDGGLLSLFSIITIIVVLFESTSKIRFASMDTSYRRMLVFYAVALMLNLIVISAAARHFFNLDSISSYLLSLMISCIEFSAIFPRHAVPKNHVTSFSKDESTFSSAFILLIPFLIITFLQTVALPFQQNFVLAILPFSAFIFAGVGIGIIVSLIFFRLTRIRSFEQSSALIVSIALLLAYLLAQQIQQSGMIAVAAMGIIFGNIVFRHRANVQQNLHKIESILELFLFMLVGIVVGVPQLPFIKLSLGLFLLYILLRFVSGELTLRQYNFFERTELAYFTPKGIATVALAFFLLNYNFEGSVVIVQLLVSFFVYSLVIDTVLEKIGFYKHR